MSEKIIENIDGQVIESERNDWYAVKGFTTPEHWDWKEIRKEWKKLKMPKDVVYDPFHIPLQVKNNPNKCGYYMLMSKRGVGKSTTFVLLGLILYKLYGIKIQYIRQTADMLKPKFAQELMSTILSCGYISKLTNGRWNYAYYYANKWCFANIDDNGKITEKTNNHFMYTLSIDQSYTYKSNYNVPECARGLNIFDEFIGKSYKPNEFVYYLDILSTIIRKTSGVLNIMLSNAVDEYSEYFEEFEVEEQVKKIKRGECAIVTSSGGTKIYVEKINHHDKNAARLNKEYFGFKNPRLYAITGEGDWNVAVCKHFDYEDTPELIDRKHYIKMGLNLVRLELYRSEKYGLHVRVQKATRYYDDSIIYTMDMIEDKRFRKGRGCMRSDALLWDLLARDKWHFATNSQKNFIDKYCLIS